MKVGNTANDRALPSTHGALCSFIALFKKKSILDTAKKGIPYTGSQLGNLPPPPAPRSWPALFLIPQAVGSLTGLPGRGMGWEDAIKIVLSGRYRTRGCMLNGNTPNVAS